MLRRIVLGLLGFALLLPTGLTAQKGSHSSSRSSTRSASSAKTSKTASRTRTAKPRPSSVSKKSTVAQRNTNGKIKRSPAARNEFMKQSGYPKDGKATSSITLFRSNAAALIRPPTCSGSRLLRPRSRTGQSGTADGSKTHHVRRGSQA